MKLAVRILVAGLLGIGTFGGSGCLGTAVQAVTAPQSLAAGAANQLASTTTGAVARALGPPSTYDQTVDDLDRIIADNGEAENIDVLRALRARLIDQPSTPTQRANAWPAPENEHDRRIKPAPIVQGFHPVSQGMRLGADPDRSHTLLIEPPADPGFAETGPRTIAVPYMPPRTSSLPEEVPRWYQLDSRPIRLHDGPTAARP